MYMFLTLKIHGKSEILAAIKKIEIKNPTNRPYIKNFQPSGLNIDKIIEVTITIIFIIPSIMAIKQFFIENLLL